LKALRGRRLGRVLSVVVLFLVGVRVNSFVGA